MRCRSLVAPLLALVAFRLLTAESYWAPCPIPELLGQIVEGPQVPPSWVVRERGLNPLAHLGPEFDGWFMHACHVDPRRRFASMVDQVEAKYSIVASHQQGLFQPLDLNIAKCHMSVAAPDGFDYARAVRQGSRLTVATKYTTIAREFFADKGVHVDLIKLYGSMELAPLTGLADAIVDLVSTGSTLKANQLVEVEQIMPISSRLVVNQAALKLKREPIRAIIDAFERAVGASS